MTEATIPIFMLNIVPLPGEPVPLHIFEARYKQMIADSAADDIVYSNLFTGVHGNYLKGSVRAAGMDPDDLPEGDLKTMNFGGESRRHGRTSGGQVRESALSKTSSRLQIWSPD